MESIEALADAENSLRSYVAKEQRQALSRSRHEPVGAVNLCNGEVLLLMSIPEWLKPLLEPVGHNGIPRYRVISPPPWLPVDRLKLLTSQP